MTLPLEGVTVVSCEQAVAAPLATRHLADLGARIIKIERPDSGDFARDYDEKVRGMSSHFVWLNRSKESLALDLKEQKSSDIMSRLIDRADVFIQNFAPGAAERLGLGAADLRRERPHLITCSISGYGSTGPYAHAKAYDLLIQAEAGLLALTGTEEAPAKAGIPVADISAGMYAFSGILAALYGRAQTGVGVELEISMFDSLIEWMGYPLHYTQYGGVPPRRSGTSHAAIAPYGVFAAGDETEFVIVVQNEREWRTFCEGVLQRDDLVHDQRFGTPHQRSMAREALDAEINPILLSMSGAELENRLLKAGLPYARRREVTEVLTHPQVTERGRWAKVDTPVGVIDTLLPPITSTSWPARMDPVPRVGQNTDDIVAWLGMDPLTVRIGETDPDAGGHAEHYPRTSPAGRGQEHPEWAGDRGRGRPVTKSQSRTADARAPDSAEVTKPQPSPGHRETQQSSPT